jgi:predicted acyl esterase
MSARMSIDWDVAIEMDDGLALRADIFRPPDPGRYPVLLSYGPYAKGLAFQEGYPSAWQKMVTEHPDVPYGSSNLYQNWEVVDPEKWVPDGYVCVRVDSRGCGRSPGFVDHFSERETRDFFECIEWTGAQSWSNGKVGLSGVSYFGINQWQVAGLNPPHLAAMCIWEGAADWYRDMTHHGGILSTFWANWYDMQVKTVQYGLGERGPRSRATGARVCGDESMSDTALAASRCQFGDDILAHPFDDVYHRVRSAVWDRITVPFLSAGNWGGQGLHLRGNSESFMRAASRQKWLEMHGLEHWTHFYTDYGVRIQKRFFGHFLKGESNGWDREPAVRLQVRHVDRFVERNETNWPIDRTHWTALHLDPTNHALVDAAPESAEALSFEAEGDGLTFLSPPMSQDMEITGPLSAKLWVSSTTTDADLFLVLRAFSADMREVTFAGAIDPHTPVAQGWLRVSHRELDLLLSRPYRPYHTHRDEQKLIPGEPVEVDIELWPTSIVLPAGYRLGLTVRGKDYMFAEKTDLKLSNFKNELRGCGPFLHDDPRDRPAATYAGHTTLHFGSCYPSHVLLPVIPAAEHNSSIRTAPS